MGQYMQSDNMEYLISRHMSSPVGARLNEFYYNKSRKCVIPVVCVKLGNCI